MEDLRAEAQEEIKKGEGSARPAGMYIQHVYDNNKQGVIDVSGVEQAGVQRNKITLN